jgi:hypothetical protein
MPNNYLLNQANDNQIGKIKIVWEDLRIGRGKSFVLTIVFIPQFSLHVGGGASF